METLMAALAAPLLATGAALERAVGVARQIAAGLEALADEAGAPIDATMLARRQRGPHTAPNGRSTSPTVICTVCGRLLSAGDERVSHGLCDDCFAGFVQDTQ
jgi:hypothetical protein